VLSRISGTSSLSFSSRIYRLSPQFLLSLGSCEKPISST
jgi:hypothetical protein